MFGCLNLRYRMIPEPYKPGFFPPSPPFQSLVLMPSETLSDKKAMVMPLALISSVFHDIISFNHNPEWLSKRIRRSNFSLFFDCRYFPPFSRKSPDFFHSLSIPFSSRVLPEAHTLQKILREEASSAAGSEPHECIGFTHILYDEAYLSASRVLYRRRRNSSSWHFRTVICATSGRRESSFRGNYHVKNRNHSVRKISLNPPPKIEFHRYCKGLYANFMHPLVKKRFYNIMITMKEQRWWISDFSVLLHF